MDSAQLINQTSGKEEYYTPKEIIEAARAVLVTIDLDPASCEIANQVVQAERIWTKEDDGLSKPWFGRVWMNHPFGGIRKKCSPDCTSKTCRKRGYHIPEDKPGNGAWIKKLVNSFHSGTVTEALCITYACTSEAWFKPLLNFPQCFLVPRTNYYDVEGNVVPGVTKGSVVTYFGKNELLFARKFSRLGITKICIDTWPGSNTVVTT